MQAVRNLLWKTGGRVALCQLSVMGSPLELIPERPSGLVSCGGNLGLGDGLTRWDYVAMAAGAVTAVAAIGALSCYVMQNRVALFSALVERYSYKVVNDYRNEFRSCSVRDLREVSDNHSHPTAAMIRTAMNYVINDYVERTDREIYSISMSQADERAGLRGNRFFFSGKDLSYSYKNDKVYPDDVIKMSDVGYYTELPDYLDGHEVLLYEIVPYRVATGVANAIYSFNKKGRIVETVDGNAGYEHELWSFAHDHVLVPKWNGVWEYLIETIQHPEFPEYRVVGLFPRRFVYAPFSWFLSGPELTRRKVVHGTWACIESQHSDPASRGVKYISLGRAENASDAFLPMEVFESAMTRVSGMKNVDLASLEIYLEQESKDPRYSFWRSHQQSFRTAATVLNDYAQTGTRGKRRDCISIPAAGNVYTPLNKEFRPLCNEYESSMHSLVPPGRYPMVTGAFVPSKGRPSEECAVQERIVKVKNVVRPPNRYHGYVEEFVRYLIPDDMAGTGVPVGSCTVYERQSRPSQRSILERAAHWFGCQRVRNKAFVKAEAYGAVAATRMISTVPASFKYEYSAYVYSFADNVMKRQAWYAFGLTPSELEVRLYQHACDKLQVVSTDFSKFDGRISDFLRGLERRILMRYFGPTYATEALRLHREQSRMPGVTRRGIHYAAGSHRLSGSSETAAFNSTDNAFVQFCAYRESGKGPDAAWNSLGLYGGDDGLSFNLDVDVLSRVAADTGMSMTLEPLHRGDVFPFLGRFWYGAWNGPATSTADWRRQLPKLHLTANNELSNRECLINKALGLLATDEATPLLGIWAYRVLAATSTSLTRTVDPEFLPYVVRGGGSFRNPPQGVAVQQLLRSCGWREDVYVRMYRHIMTAGSLEALFPEQRPLFEFRSVAKIDAVVGGRRVEAGQLV